MHGFPVWFGWLLDALSYTPYLVGAVVVGGAVLAARRRHGRK